jgi:hypothetical protein
MNIPRRTVASMTTAASLFIASALVVTPSFAFTVYETGALGPTGLTSNIGAGIYSDQFIGVRFAVNSDVTTTAVGGHFGTQSFVGNNQFFGAIVALSGPSDFPDSADLSTPDVLGATLLTFPGPSADISAPLSVSLAPGNYALIFGTGLFGATGEGGGAAFNNNMIGVPDFISYRTLDQWNVATIDGARFFITGIPEPNTAVLILMAFTQMILTRRRIR